MEVRLWVGLSQLQKPSIKTTHPSRALLGESYEYIHSFLSLYSRLRAQPAFVDLVVNNLLQAL